MGNFYGFNNSRTCWFLTIRAERCVGRWMKRTHLEAVLGATSFFSRVWYEHANAERVPPTSSHSPTPLSTSYPISSLPVESPSTGSRRRRSGVSWRIPASPRRVGITRHGAASSGRRGRAAACEEAAAADGRGGGRRDREEKLANELDSSGGGHGVVTTTSGGCSRRPAAPPSAPAAIQ